MTAGFWSELEIAPTADVAQIRRAYARRLKTIDVDENPQAFIALREALAEALHSAFAPAEHLVGQAPEAPAPDPPPIEEPLAEPPPLDAVALAEDAPDDARFIALERLLFGEAPPAAEAVAAAVGAILAHPEMERIDHEDRVEEWLARILYDAIPRSDPAIPLVAAHFGWEQRSEQWNQPPILAALLDRMIVAGNFAALVDSSHRHHRAYLDLTSDKPSLGLERFTRDRGVAMLLSAIRMDCPEMEAGLNPQRVALWDQAAGGRIEPREVRSQPYLVLGLVALPWLFLWWLFWRPGYDLGARVGAVAWAVMLAFILIADPPPAPNSRADGTGTYTTAEADLGPILRFATGYDLEQLSQQNYALGARLAEHWDLARRAGQARPALADIVLMALSDFSRNAARGGDDSVREEYWRLRAAELNYLQYNERPDVCDSNARGLDRNRPPIFSEEILGRQRAFFQRALRENVPATPPVGGLDYEIGEDVMRAGATRSGLSRQRFQTALGGGGDAASRCSARLGFIEAVLELPAPRRAVMLRNMSAGL